jgi:hypothetical protein
MRTTTAAVTVLPTGAATGATVVLLTLFLPGPLGLAGAGGLLCCGVFLLWPWAVLPVGIVGGAIAGGLLGGGDVRAYIAVHVLLLAAGAVALLVRHWLRIEPAPRRTVADTGMLALVGLVVVAAVHGLAVGNAPGEVLVAAYQVAAIPAYFFFATQTLGTAPRLRAAGLLYLVMAGAVTVATVAAPGRHGGLITLLAIPALIWAAGRERGWRRLLVVLLAGLFALDVVLASYRGMWLAAGVTVLLMLLRGDRTVRSGLRATALAGAALAALLTLHPAVRHRAGEVATGLDQSAGYRAPESSVGLGVFADQPLIGAGLGQSTPDVFLAGFAVTDVGPVYHAFYVTVLANLGLIGLALVLWPILRSVRAGFAARGQAPVTWAALCCGFLAAAFFAAPTDGHWELGLLPALILLSAGPVAARHPVVAVPR